MSYAEATFNQFFEKYASIDEDLKSRLVSYFQDNQALQDRNSRDKDILHDILLHAASQNVPQDEIESIIKLLTQSKFDFLKLLHHHAEQNTVQQYQIVKELIQHPAKQEWAGLAAEIVNGFGSRIGEAEKIFLMVAEREQRKKDKYFFHPTVVPFNLEGVESEDVVGSMVRFRSYLKFLKWLPQPVEELFVCTGPHNISGKISIKDDEAKILFVDPTGRDFRNLQYMAIECIDHFDEIFGDMKRAVYVSREKRQFTEFGCGYYATDDVAHLATVEKHLSDKGGSIFDYFENQVRYYIKEKITDQDQIFNKLVFTRDPIQLLQFDEAGNRTVLKSAYEISLDNKLTERLKAIELNSDEITEIKDATGGLHWVTLPPIFGRTITSEQTLVDYQKKLSEKERNAPINKKQETFSQSVAKGMVVNFKKSDIVLMELDEKNQDSNDFHLRLYHKEGKLIYYVKGEPVENTKLTAEDKTIIISLFERKLYGKVADNADVMTEREQQACRNLFMDAAAENHVQQRWLNSRLTKKFNQEAKYCLDYILKTSEHELDKLPINYSELGFILNTCRHLVAKGKESDLPFQSYLSQLTLQTENDQKEYPFKLTAIRLMLSAMSEGNVANVSKDTIKAIVEFMTSSHAKEFFAPPQNTEQAEMAKQIHDVLVKMIFQNNSYVDACYPKFETTLSFSSFSKPSANATKAYQAALVAKTPEEKYQILTEYMQADDNKQDVFAKNLQKQFLCLESENQFIQDKDEKLGYHR